MVTCRHCGSKITSTDILFSKQDAFYKGKPLHLTPRERHVLKLLWEMDFVSLFEKGWHGEGMSNMATVVSYVRKKLARVGAPYIIRTVRNEGYLLQPIVAEGEGEGHEQGRSG